MIVNFRSLDYYQLIHNIWTIIIYFQCCLCFCKCCFWCLEKFMKYINRNAYIMTAVYGGNFCSSAKDAFSLLMRNFLRWNIILESLDIKMFNISAIITELDNNYILNFRVFILDNVCDFLLLLGKLVIVGSVGCLSFFVFSGKHKIFFVDVKSIICFLL